MRSTHNDLQRLWTWSVDVLHTFSRFADILLVTPLQVLVVPLPAVLATSAREAATPDVLEVRLLLWQRRHRRRHGPHLGWLCVRAGRPPPQERARKRSSGQKEHEFCLAPHAWNPKPPGPNATLPVPPWRCSFATICERARFHGIHEEETRSNVSQTHAAFVRQCPTFDLQPSTGECLLQGRPSVPKHCRSKRLWVNFLEGIAPVQAGVASTTGAESTTLKVAHTDRMCRVKASCQCKARFAARSGAAAVHMWAT